MLYYKVRKEYDNKSRYRFGRRGGLVADGIYIGGELFTAKEVEKEYNTHLVGLHRDELFEAIEIPKSRVFWLFGARFQSEQEVK